MPADKEKASRGSGAAVVVITLLVAVLPVLYVLSIGPVMWYYEYELRNPAWIDLVYWPLLELYKASPAFAWFLDQYMHWWID